MYKYYRNGELLAESKAPISFNKVLLPALAEIEPVVEKAKRNTTEYTNQEENDGL